MISRVIGLRLGVGSTVGIDRAFMTFGSGVYIQRIRGVEVHHPVVLEVDTRHPVVGGREEKGVVEPDLEGARLDLSVPVHRGSLGPQPEVPLANHSGPVTRLAKQLGKGENICRDAERSIGRKDTHSLPETIETCEHRVA